MIILVSSLILNTNGLILDQQNKDDSFVVSSKTTQIANETSEINGNYQLNIHEKNYNQSTIRVEQNQLFVFPELNVVHDLQINQLSSAENLLQTNNSLTNILDQTSLGEFEYNTSNSEVDLSLSVSDQMFASTLDLETDISLRGNEEFVLQYDNLSWNELNRTDLSIFGYISVTFTFGISFAITVILDWTQTYEQLGLFANTSEVVKLKSTELGNVKFSLIEIAGFLNMQIPSKLSHIKFDIYLNQVYSVDINFRTLKILSYLERLNLIINNEFMSSTDSLTLSVGKNEEVALRIPNELSFVDLEIILSLHRIYIQNVKLSYENENVIIFRSTIIRYFTLFDYSVFDFPKGISIISINATIYSTETTHQIILKFSSDVKLFVEGQFQIISDPLDIPISLLQGKSFSLSISNLKLINSSFLLHTFTKEFVKLYIEQSQIAGLVKEQWPKGKVALIRFYQNQSLTINYFNLEFHPSQLLPIPILKFNPAEKNVIPIYFLNLTSNTVVKADKITISSQGEKLKEFNSNNVEINPGEYETGYHEIEINASSTSLVWQVLMLTFEVEKFQPNIKTDIVINNSSYFELILTISDVANWSLQADYQLIGSTINRNGPIVGPVLVFLMNQTVIESELIFNFTIFFREIDLNYSTMVDLADIISFNNPDKDQIGFLRSKGTFILGIVIILTIIVVGYKSNGILQSSRKIEF